METEGVEGKRVAEILDRIRARLADQINVESAISQPASFAATNGESGVPRLRALFEAARSLQAQIGAVNPRPGGPLNRIVQLFKRFIRLSLRWYTRPIVRHQEATLQLLSEMIKVLEQEHSRLDQLAGVNEPQPNELAEFHRQALEKLEWISEGLAKWEKERLAQRD